MYTQKKKRKRKKKEKKNVLEPQKKSIDLGFYLNSEDVIVTLPEDKVDKKKLLV